MLQYTIGHLPSEHLHVWATCTTGHLPFWANFNCALKIRNHHIIRCVYGAIRTYYIDIISTTDVDERVTAFPTTWWIHMSTMAPCIHPISGHRSKMPTKIMFRAPRTQLSPFTRAHEAAFQQPTPKPVFARFQATSTAGRNVFQPAEPALYPQVAFKSIGESELCVVFDVFQQFK